MREGQRIDLVFVDRQRADTRYTRRLPAARLPAVADLPRAHEGPAPAERDPGPRAATAARIDVRWYVGGKSRGALDVRHPPAPGRRATGPRHRIAAA